MIGLGININSFGRVVFNPVTLFANGEQGAWYDPSDLTTLYQDSTGTTPVTTDGDPVGLMLDKSGNGNHASQATSASRPVYIDAAPQYKGLSFDYVDDTLLTNFPDGLNGDLVVCGTEGSWVDEGVSVAAGGDLEIGPVDLPNTPDILPALGDIIGWVPIDRTLAAEERARVIEYYKGRGAKGQLAEGPELIINGTFDDLSGVTPLIDTDGSAVSVGGALRIESDSDGSPAAVYFDLGTTIQAGATVRLRFDVPAINVAENSALRLRSSITVPVAPSDGDQFYFIFTSGFTPPLTLDLYARPDTDMRYLVVSVNGTTTSNSIDIDKLSLKELIPEEELA